MACPGPAGQVGSVRPPRQAAPRLPGEGGHRPHRGAPGLPPRTPLERRWAPPPARWLPGVWGGGRPGGLCSAPGLAGWALGCSHLGTGVGGPGACPGAPGPGSSPPCPSLLFVSLLEGSLGGGGCPTPPAPTARGGGACSRSEPAWRWLGPPPPASCPCLCRGLTVSRCMAVPEVEGLHTWARVQRWWAEPHPQSCLSASPPCSQCGPGAGACL